MVRYFAILLTSVMLLVGNPFSSLAQDTYDLLPELEPITAENVPRLQPIAMLGVDLINDLAWSPDGKTLLLAGSTGLWRYNAEQPDSPPVLIEGYSGLFRSVAFSSDGQLFTTGNDQGKLRLWEATTLVEIAVLEMDNSVEEIVFSSGGDLVAAGTNRGTVQLWNLKTQAILQSWNAPEKDNYPSVSDMVFSPDNLQLAVARRWGSQLYSIETGEPVISFEDYWSNNIVFSRDGALVFISREQSTGEGAGFAIPLNVWNTKTGQLVKSITAGDANFHSLFFLDNNILLIGDGKNIHKLDFADILDTPENQQPVDDMGAPVGDIFLDGDPLIHTTLSGGDLLALSPDQKTIAVVTNTMLQLIDVQTGATQVSLRLPYFDIVQDWRIGAIAFSPTQPLMAYSNGSEIQLFDTQTGRSKGFLSGHEAQVISLAFSPDGKWLVSGGGGNLGIYCYGMCDGEETPVRVWDVEAQTQVASSQSNYDGVVVNLVEMSSDGSLVMSASGYGGIGRDVQLWEWKSNHVVDFEDRDYNFVSFSPLEMIIATSASGTSPGYIEVWDMKKNTRTKLFESDGNTFTKPMFSWDGSFVAASDLKGAIRVWSVISGELLAEFEGRRPMAFSRDSTIVAYLTDEGIGIHDIVTDAERIHIATITSADDNSLFFNTDGTLVFHSSNLWNTISGEMVFTLGGESSVYRYFGDPYLFAAMSSDGRIIAYSSGRGLRLWGILLVDENSNG